MAFVFLCKFLITVAVMLNISPFSPDLTELCHSCASVSESLPYPLYLSHFVYSWDDLSEGTSNGAVEVMFPCKLLVAFELVFVSSGSWHQQWIWFGLCATVDRTTQLWAFGLSSADCCVSYWPVDVSPRFQRCRRFNYGVQLFHVYYYPYRKLVELFCTDIWLFCPNVCNKLYDVVCSGLEDGTFELKQVSLAMISLSTRSFILLISVSVVYRVAWTC